MIKSKSAHSGLGGTTTVTFSLEFDRPVSVVGDFNGWNPSIHPLAGIGDEMPLSAEVQVSVELLPGRYAFRYLAEGGMFFDDPDAIIESNGIGETHGVVEVFAIVEVLDTPTVPAGSAATAKAKTADPVIELEADGATVILADADDLTLVDGIGPKANAALLAGGVTTFVQLADVSLDELKAILAAANVRVVSSASTWSAQAKKLANESATSTKTPGTKTPGTKTPGTKTPGTKTPGKKLVATAKK